MIEKLSDNIFRLTYADHKSRLFENLWPVEQGVSYNAYLIVDDKIALIDTVDIEFTRVFINEIKECIGSRKVDYIVVNHVEPDHTGALRELLIEYPGLAIVGNDTTFKFLDGYYHLDTKKITVGKTDTLSLGDSSLYFIKTPMVHWPETMMTYCGKYGMLFTGDAFGAFSVEDNTFVDEEEKYQFFEPEIRRYYANVMAKYGRNIQHALRKTKDLSVNYICSTHGPVWSEFVSRLLQDYEKLSTFQAEPGVCICYGSMYGNTKNMAEYMADILSKKGIHDIVLHDVSKSHLSYIAADIFKYKGLILGGPTYNGQIFPPLESVVNYLEYNLIKNKILGIFGSKTWTGGAVKKIKDRASKWDMEVIDTTHETLCSPQEEDFDNCAQIAVQMAKRLIPETVKSV